MTTKETMASLDEWQAVCDAATEGPWEASHVDSRHREVVAPHSPQYWVCHDCATQQDTEFVALARDNWPACIKALRELDAENDRLGDMIAQQDVRRENGEEPEITPQ